VLKAELAQSYIAQPKISRLLLTIGCASDWIVMLSPGLGR
jgi:hypothetical protein